MRKVNILVDLLDDMQGDAYQNGKWDAKTLRRLEDLINQHLVMDRKAELQQRWKHVYKTLRPDSLEKTVEFMNSWTMTGIEVAAGILTFGASELVYSCQRPGHRRGIGRAFAGAAFGEKRLGSRQRGNDLRRAKYRYELWLRKGGAVHHEKSDTPYHEKDLSAMAGLNPGGKTGFASYPAELGKRAAGHLLTSRFISRGQCRWCVWEWRMVCVRLVR